MLELAERMSLEHDERQLVRKYVWIKRSVGRICSIIYYLCVYGGVISPCAGQHLRSLFHSTLVIGKQVRPT